MKFKSYFFLLLTLIFLGCENDDNNRDNNPCLTDKSVNFPINLRLPLYSDLQFTGGVFIDTNDRTNFIKGIYITNIGSNTYLAFELAEPNDCLQECSLPELKDGFFNYDCGDTSSKYDILGNKIDREEDEFNMRQYNASLSGDILTISY